MISTSATPPPALLAASTTPVLLVTSASYASTSPTLAMRSPTSSVSVRAISYMSSKPSYRQSIRSVFAARSVISDLFVSINSRSSSIFPEKSLCIEISSGSVCSIRATFSVMPFVFASTVSMATSVFDSPDSSVFSCCLMSSISADIASGTIPVSAMGCRSLPAACSADTGML